MLCSGWAQPSPKSITRNYRHCTERKGGGWRVTLTYQLIFLPQVPKSSWRSRTCEPRTDTMHGCKKGRAWAEGAEEQGEVLGTIFYPVTAGPIGLKWSVGAHPSRFKSRGYSWGRYGQGRIYEGKYRKTFLKNKIIIIIITKHRTYFLLTVLVNSNPTGLPVEHVKIWLCKTSPHFVIAHLGSHWAVQPYPAGPGWAHPWKYGVEGEGSPLTKEFGYWKMPH